MSLTVCLLNFKRPDNLRRILDRLAEQTICEQMSIFLWNNATAPFRHPAVDWQVDSSRNAVCPPRWWMAVHAETEFVATLDDDLIPADERVFADALDVAQGPRPTCAIGPFGVILQPGRPYFPHVDVRCPPQDTPVDLILGRCLIARTAALRTALRLGDLVGGEDDGVGDDIAVCGALAAGRRGRHLVPGRLAARFEELPAAGEALERHPEHPRRREATRRRWFPEDA